MEETTEVRDVELSARDRLAMDLRPYLGDLEYDRNVFINETRHYLRMTLEGIIEAGRRLICLKEMEGHGSFGEILNDIGIDHYRACELMLITKKFGSKFAPGANLKKLEDMGKKRLILLASLSDDYIQEMEEKEEIAGIPLDEFKAMSRDQLRDKVRELKRQNENGQKQNRRLREKIDRLEKDKEGLDLSSLDGLKKWIDKVSNKLYEINHLMLDGNAPDREVFEGENGDACQCLLSAIDVMLNRINNTWDHTLKGKWGVE